MDEFERVEPKNGEEIARQAIALFAAFEDTSSGEENPHEGLAVLLWALNLFEMPSADERCSPDDFRSAISSPDSGSASDFIKSARCRSPDELAAEAERIWQLHWQARDGGRHHKGPREPVDLNIIGERHHAINWIIGDEEWDDVLTDT